MRIGQVPDAPASQRVDNPCMTTETGEATATTEAFQVPIEAAEAYEAAFVPAFFAQWAPLLCDAAGVTPGQRVLDVACGTGVVARVAAERVGSPNVVGVDLNEAMLTVARRVAPAIDWQRGDASALPFPDGSFDSVLCQMALMFFPDKVKALAEMARVARPNATVAVLVPSALESQPAYGPFVAMAAEHAGPEARSLLSTYFAEGLKDRLSGLFERAGLSVTSAETRHGRTRYPTVDALVSTEVDSTPLRERLSKSDYENIKEGAREVLEPFTARDGSLDAPFEVLVVTGQRRNGAA